MLKSNVSKGCYTVLLLREKKQSERKKIVWISAPKALPLRLQYTFKYVSMRLIARCALQMHNAFERTNALNA